MKDSGSVTFGSTSLCWCRGTHGQNPVTSDHTVKEGTSRKAFVTTVFQIWTHLFPSPLFFAYQVPLWKFLSIVVLAVASPAPSSADPGVYHPWLALEPVPVPRSHPWHAPKTFLTAVSCGIAEAASIREVKVPSVNQVCVTDTSLICLEKISSTSHPDHAVCNKLFQSWFTSSQQAFCPSYTTPLSIHGDGFPGEFRC